MIPQAWRIKPDLAILRQPLWGALVLVLVLSACATVPRLESPRVIATELRVDRLTGADARFTVTLTLRNPNDRDVSVDAIDATLRIEEVPVGVAQLATPVRLPARGEAPVVLTVRAGLADALLAASAVARRVETGGTVPPVARYAVTGTAVLEGGVSLPFARSGEFTLPVRPSPPR